MACRAGAARLHRSVAAEREYSAGIAFLLWLTCLFGLCGLHRFYLGKPVTGFLYLITLGFLGIGQIIDLARLDSMVEGANLSLDERRRRALGTAQLSLPAAAAPVSLTDPAEEMRRSLLRAAASRGGRLSVTQGVMATGKNFHDVESALDDMVRSGYVDVDNDPDTGIVVYRFGELA
jgi:hypothetical protein